MKLVFEGVVTCGNESRTSYCEGGDHVPQECPNLNGALWIGEHDVVSEVGEATWWGPVTCAIFAGSLLGDTAFQGALRLLEGWGYSEYTPMESDQLFVGPHDLLKIIGELKGQHVTVWFADEAINVLERS